MSLWRVFSGFGILRPGPANFYMAFSTCPYIWQHASSFLGWQSLLECGKSSSTWYHRSGLAGRFVRLRWVSSTCWKVDNLQDFSIWQWQSLSSVLRKNIASSVGILILDLTLVCLPSFDVLNGTLFESLHTLVLAIDVFSRGGRFQALWRGMPAPSPGSRYPGSGLLSVGIMLGSVLPKIRKLQLYATVETRLQLEFLTSVSSSCTNVRHLGLFLHDEQPFDMPLLCWSQLEVFACSYLVFDVNGIIQKLVNVRQLTGRLDLDVRNVPGLFPPRTRLRRALETLDESCLHLRRLALALGIPPSGALEDLIDLLPGSLQILCLSLGARCAHLSFPSSFANLLVQGLRDRHRCSGLFVVAFRDIVHTRASFEHFGVAEGISGATWIDAQDALISALLGSELAGSSMHLCAGFLQGVFWGQVRSCDGWRVIFTIASSLLCL